MIALVRIALRRPYTFVVLALTILIIGPLTALRTPVDIFPDIRIPVIAIIWQYTGLPPEQMAGRITSQSQRALTTTVNDIEHMEANSYNGLGIIKVFFQPGADIRLANAQITAVSQTQLKQMPPNTTPPLILNYNASTVPIIQLALSGSGMSEQQLADLGLNTIRTPLVTVPGAAIPLPYGGKLRQVQIDLDPIEMQARGLSGQDVANALAAQNLITPVGTQKIGSFEYAIQLNNAPSVISELGDLPIKSVNGAIVFIHDVAHVRDGNPPQTNIVHVEGSRSVLMQILKNGSVSTLSIIAGVKRKVLEIKETLPSNLNIGQIGDQSIFINAAVNSVIREGVIAAALTSLMILIFLGSWRSTLIIAISIPLSVLGSIAALGALGETLNIMTLGGLALAVGILVDDATVTIENINWHLEQGKEVETAIMDGAAQIVTPAFVSLLCICIVFVPMFFLTGVARFLFVPMAEAVMAAMICSFILSRTLVPTMANYLLRKHAPHTDMHGLDGPLPRSRNPLVRMQRAFEAAFERLRLGYRDLLSMALRRRAIFVACFLAVVVGSFSLTPYLGRDFFPSVDAGQILMHARARVGTRVEETAEQFAEIEKAIRRIIPPDELATVVDNIGFPSSGINMTYNNTGTIGSQDGEIQIKLTEEHRPTAEYIRLLREELPQRFPGVTFSFLPADIVSQILNFGAPAPIDLQIRGPDLENNFAYAQTLLRNLRHVPGLADARIQQSLGNPAFDVDVDRTRAQFVGITERDVTNSMVVNLAGSGQVAPTYWLNPDNGVNYAIVMQTPQYQIDSLNALKNLPITAAGTVVADTGRDRRHQPRDPSPRSIRNITSSRWCRSTAPRRAATSARSPPTSKRSSMRRQRIGRKDAQVYLLGQVNTMNSAFSGLLFGLLGAIVLIYLLIVVNFQSWGDPFVIITALPAALAGIVWTLFATQTTLSVPALTGAIMCMGVATANSVLVISFARERLEQSRRSGQRRDRSGLRALPPGADDGARHDHRHGADGARARRRRRAERAARPRRGRRADLCYFRHVDVRAGRFQHPARPPTARHRPRRLESRMPPDSDSASGGPSPPRSSALHAGIIGRRDSIAAIAAVVVIMGVTTRKMADARLSEWTEKQAVPVVAVATPDTQRTKRRHSNCPGRLEAYSQAQMFARVSGYLKEWRADIGTPVKAGELLAEIDAPDLDQQIMQAEAGLASAKANAGLAEATLQRGQQLITSGVGVETGSRPALGRCANKQGLVKSAQANLDRLRVLEKYKRIIAPFDGLVTARTTDVGALINAGRRRRTGAVRGLRHQQTARLCQRAAELRAQHHDRHQGADHGAGISGPRLSRDGRSLGAVRRRGVRHDAHAARRR